MDDKLLIIDTETTGFPFGGWLGHPRQPHLVQIGMILVDREDNELRRFDAIVRPDGWKIPKKSTDVHGITTEQALAEGIPVEDVLDVYEEMLAPASTVIAHYARMEVGIMGICYARAKRENPMGERLIIDTMKEAGPLLHPNPVNLASCYHLLVGEEMKKKHHALHDAEACRRVYWAIVARRAIAAVQAQTS